MATTSLHGILQEEMTIVAVVFFFNCLLFWTTQLVPRHCEKLYGGEHFQLDKCHQFLQKKRKYVKMLIPFGKQKMKKDKIPKCLNMRKDIRPLPLSTPKSYHSELQAPRSNFLPFKLRNYWDHVPGLSAKPDFVLTLLLVTYSLHYL